MGDQPPSCLIIGDANLDLIADVTDKIESWAGTANACLFSHIRECVGGNGVFFAEAAREAGFSPVSLELAVGRTSTGEVDGAGGVVLNHLDQHGIEYQLTHSKLPTGKTFIIYHGEDERLLVADRGANIEKRSTGPPDGPSPDFLYLSGYCLLDEAERRRTLLLVHRYKDAGAFTFLDVVPHDLPALVDWNTYLGWCGGMDGIAIEAPTLRDFLGLMEFAEVGRAGIDALQEHFELSLVRLNSASDYAIATPEGRMETTVRYRRQEASLRFTDRVIAGVALEYLTNRSTLLTDAGWIEAIQERVDP